MIPFLFFWGGGELSFFPSLDTKHTLTSLLPPLSSGRMAAGRTCDNCPRRGGGRGRGGLVAARPSCLQDSHGGGKRGETLGGQDGRLVFSPYPFYFFCCNFFLVERRLLLLLYYALEALLFKKDYFWTGSSTLLLPQKRLIISGELRKIVAAAEIFGLNSITLQG